LPLLMLLVVRAKWQLFWRLMIITRRPLHLPFVSPVSLRSCHQLILFPCSQPHPVVFHPWPSIS